MGSVFIGVDVGTGSARAGVFDEAGRLLASARRPIAIWHEAGGIVEQSSGDIWSATTAAVAEAVASSGVPGSEVGGIGFDATCSLVVLGPEGRPVAVGPSGDSRRNVVVWMDHRAVEQSDRINATADPVLAFVGGKISPEMQTPKLLWLKENMPRSFDAAGHFLDLSDFLTFRATGSLARSLCTVTCKWTYLAHENRWSDDFFRRLGLDALVEDGHSRIGSQMRVPGEALGAGLSGESATGMGLSPGIPVAASLIDAHAGAIGTLAAGAGVVDPRRRLALILGTSACCMAISDEVRFIDGLWGPYFSALTPGQWLTEGGQSAAGAAVDHLIRMHPAYRELAERAGDQAFEEIERDIVRRAGSLSGAVRLAKDLHVLPDLIGNRSPMADPNSRGALVGLDLRDDYDSLIELYAAVVCGLAYGLAQIIEALERGGYDFEAIVVSGGASRSPLVRQIIADATGKRIAVPETAEPVLLGSAMLGAVASGRYSMGEAMVAMSRLADAHDPAGGDIADLHARKYRAFLELQSLERRLRGVMQGTPE